MKAEDVYNISIHLSDNELVKLIGLLKQHVINKSNKGRRNIRKKLISDEEARAHILKRVFKIYR